MSDSGVYLEGNDMTEPCENFSGYIVCNFANDHVRIYRISRRELPGMCCDVFSSDMSIGLCLVKQA